MKKSEKYRLAIREEGEWVVAYFASIGTMEGAVEIGRMARKFLDFDREIFERWRGVLQDAFGSLYYQATGERVVWPEPPQPAPEHERAGRG